MMNALQVNPIGAMLQGQQAASQSREMARQNALNQLYQTQGAGIAQGNPESLNALAALDPMAAAQMRQQENALNMRREEMELSRDNMAQDNRRADAQLAISQEGLEMKREQARQAAEAQVAQMSALERQQEAEKIRQGLTGAIRFYEAGDEAGYNQYLQSIGVDPAEAPFAQFPEVAAAYDGVLEALQGAREARQGPETEYGVVDGQFYDKSNPGAGAQPIPGFEPKQDSGLTINNNMGGGSKLFETLDSKQGEMFNNLIDEGMKTPTKVARLDQLEEYLGAETTPQGFEAAIKKGLGDFGITTEGLSTLQAAEALINSMVPEQRLPGSGPMSDADLALFKKSLPRLINTRDGNLLIIRTLRGIAQYQQGQAQIANAVANRELTPAQARDALAQLENPLLSFRRAGDTRVGGDMSQSYSNFEEFAGNADVRAKAEEYGVSVEEMWDILKGGE